jgi:hypothetical protein
MRFREILVALLIIAVGVFAYYAKSGRIDGILEGPGIFLSGGEEFVFEETREVPAPLPALVEIDNAHGEIEVRGASPGGITVGFKKVVYERTRDRAQAVADQVALSVRREGDRLVLSTNRDSLRRRNFETHFTVVVPPETRLKLRNSYGPVKVLKTGAAEIENPHGDIRAEEVAGPLTAANSYAEVLVRDVDGDLRLACPHSDITVEAVRGEAVIEHRYAEISMRDISKKVVVAGSHSRIKGTRLPGGAEVESSYESVSLEEVGPVSVRGPHCTIGVKNVNGSADITGRYSRVEASGIRGDLLIDAPNTEIRASGVTAGEIRIATSYQDVALVDFAGRTTVRMEHGRLTLEPASFAGALDVDAAYADIVLAWPAADRSPFEGRAKNGRIIWNLPEKPDVEETNGLSLTKAFQESVGKPAVLLSTSYGDIRVEGKAGADR